MIRIFVLFMAIAKAQNPCPDPNRDKKITEAKDMAHSMVRAMETYAAKDMHDYCEKNTFDGAGQLCCGLDLLQTTQFRKDPEQFMKDSKDVKFSTPWLLSTFPKEETAFKAYKASVYMHRDNADADDPLDNHNAYETMIQNNLQKKVIPTQEQLNKIKSTIDSIEYGKETKASKQLEATEGTLATAGLGLECGELSASVFNCPKAIREVKSMMAVKDNFYSLLPTYKEVLTDPDYVDGLQSLALELMNKVKNKKAPGGDLFNDLVKHFQKNKNVTSTKAQDMAWNTLGVLSSGGANLWQRLGGVKASANNPTADLALRMISGALPILDVRAEKSGHFYSYPSNIKSTCNNGKPYHFWMSAFLSRKLVQKGFSAEDAAAAVYISQKGYQAVSSVGSRQPERIFKVPSYDPFNNVMRMDISYAAAGAQFGAASLSKLSTKKYDVDNGIRELIGKAGFPEKLTTKEQEKIDVSTPIGMLATYHYWDHTMKPNSVFEFYQK